MLPHFSLNPNSKSMVKRTSRKGVLAVVFLCLVTYVFAFAGAAEAVTLTINNPGDGFGSVEIWVNGAMRDFHSFFPSDSYPIAGLNPGDLVVMQNEAPQPLSVFSGYSENNFTMPAVNKTVDARFDLAYQLTVKITETVGSGGSHRVDVNWGTGSASCTAASCNYDIPQGATVTLIPHADGPGDFQFDGWVGDVPAANMWDVPYVFTITGNFTAEAQFSWTGQKKITIDADGTCSGAVHVGTNPPGRGEAYVTSFPTTLSYWNMTVVYLTAYPDVGCVFVQWTGDGTDTADVPPKRQVTVSGMGGQTVTATFDKINYNLTTSQVGGGTVTPSTTYVYDQGLAVSATPDPGWQFVNWTGDTGNIVDPNASSTNLKSPLYTDTSITANFSVVDYQITASAGPNGSIAPSGVISPVNVQSPDQVFTITADPNYAIADVLVNGASVGAVASYTFATGSITSNQTIDASFAPIDYQITATAGAGGSIAPSGVISPVNVESPDQVFTITPDAGYDIADVLVNGASVGAVPSYTFAAGSITSNQTINASFAPIDYQITATAGAGGSIAPSGVISPVNVESPDQFFTITPDAGYDIADVLVNGASVGAVASYTFVTGSITSDQTIDASFVVVDYQITATAGVGGSIAPSGVISPVNVESPDQVFTITPAMGYEITDVLVNGASVGVVASYTFTTGSVTSDQTIDASFAKINYTLTISVATGSGTVAPPSGTTYVFDDGLAISATPDPGWEFVDWSGESAKLDDPTSANTNIINPMDADTNVAANFQKIVYTLTISVGTGNGTVAPVSGTNYVYDDGLPVSATPDPGWEFVNPAPICSTRLLQTQPLKPIFKRSFIL
jgi:hypothetical protein